MSKPNLLFLCTGNSCRSQMAEGIARHYFGDVVTFHSAGTKKHGLNPYAVKATAEIGIDISSHFSKTVDEIDAEFDYVITVCGHADETCPFFPAKTAIIHRGFDDPPKLAEGLEDEEEIMAPYRRVREEIKAYLLTLPDAISL